MVEESKLDIRPLKSTVWHKGKRDIPVEGQIWSSLILLPYFPHYKMTLRLIIWSALSMDLSWLCLLILKQFLKYRRICQNVSFFI